MLLWSCKKYIVWFQIKTFSGYCKLAVKGWRGGGWGGRGGEICFTLSERPSQEIFVLCRASRNISGVKGTDTPVCDTGWNLMFCGL